MDAVLAELRRGALGAGDLRQRLGVSRATLMRTVREVQPRVLAIGRARATRYALRETWPSLSSAHFPVFRVLASGEARAAGELVTLAARQTAWMPGGVVSDGLPIALADARPSGFLGRHFAANHADLQLPLRLSDWSDHHILLALSRRGEDLTGNLIVGDESFARWQGPAPTSHARADYPALADATIHGHPPGSSAGGERPKFGVFVDGRHVLVKFAARSSAGDVVARRWCDLLLLEALALKVIAMCGIAAAHAQIVDAGSQYFLESDRFDRVGARGRVSVVSLAAVQDDPAQTWSRAAAWLHNAGRLSHDDARKLRWLDAFGALIANTDRHPHNVALHDIDGDQLRLAPAFDQASMFYAPTADGQVPTRAFATPLATADTLDVWDDARAAARDFWQRAADDVRVSDGLRAQAATNARMLGGV